jgi:hypothetical protein
MPANLTRSEQSAYLRGYRLALTHVLRAVFRLRAHYPEHVFPDTGESLDARSGTMARLTCDNLRDDLARLRREAKLDL